VKLSWLIHSLISPLPISHSIREQRVENWRPWWILVLLAQPTLRGLGCEFSNSTHIKRNLNSKTLPGRQMLTDSRVVHCKWSRKSIAHGTWTNPRFLLYRNCVLMFISVTNLLHNPIVCFPERREVILRYHILFLCGPFWCVSPSSSECLPPIHVWFVQYLCVSFLSHKNYTLAHLTSLGLSELCCEKSQKGTTQCQGMSQPGKQSEEWRKAPVLHVTPLVPLQIVISQDVKAALY